MDLHRFRRVDVLRAHEPARLVGADRDQRQVEAAPRAMARREARVDVGEVLRVRRVAREEDLEVGREDRVAAPERLHAVGRAIAPTSAAPASARSRPRRRAALCHQSSSTACVDADVGEPRLEAERHDEERRRRRAARRAPSRSPRRDGRSGCARRRRRRCAAARRAPAPAARGASARRSRSGDARSENIGSVRMLPPPAWIERARVADPGQRRHHRRAGDRVASAGTRGPRRRAASRAAAASAGRRAGRFHAPLQQRGHAFRLELEIVVLEAPVAVMRRGAGREVGSAHGEQSRALRR